MSPEDVKRAAFLIDGREKLDGYLNGYALLGVTLRGADFESDMLRAALIHLRNQAEDALRAMGVTV